MDGDVERTELFLAWVREMDSRKVAERVEDADPAGVTLRRSKRVSRVEDEDPDGFTVRRSKRRSRRQRSPEQNGNVSSPPPSSKRTRRYSNRFQSLSPSVTEDVEEAGEQPQVQLDFNPPVRKRKGVNKQPDVAAEMLMWDQINEGLRGSESDGSDEDRGRRNTRSQTGASRRSRQLSLPRPSRRIGTESPRDPHPVEEYDHVHGADDAESRPSEVDEQLFSEAVADPSRWDRSSSQSVNESSSPGSQRRGQSSRAVSGRPERAARVPGAPVELCCANLACGQIFRGRSAKEELRNHFEVENLQCRPCEENYHHYLSYGMWRCENCDFWFNKRTRKHDCTKGGSVDMTIAYNRENVRKANLHNLRDCMNRLRKKRAGAGRHRPHPEDADTDPFAGVRDRQNQDVGDVPNNWLGSIVARAAADLADLGELGASDVSEWECLTWLTGLAWSEVQGLVGFQTLRPSGKYSGPFHTAFRKCFAMVIKVHGSEVANAKLLSKKLLFMLVRMIYAPVEGTSDINKVLLQRSNRFLNGEWEGLHEEHVEAGKRRRGVTGQPTLSAQRARAIRLMEAGLVAQSVSLLGDSKICDVHREGVLDQLKSQVVYEDDSEYLARGPDVPDDLYSNPIYFCDTMEADVDEGQGREGDIPAAAEGVRDDYVVKALRQMPRLGAQDWSGWRYDHIAALTKDQARWLVNIILNEESEPEVTWLLTTAKVLPFEKEDGKARACIVGSMLRMFVARVVRLATRKDLQEEYESFNQFGLGTSSGIDTAFHSVVEHHRSAVKAYAANPEVMEGSQPVLVKYDFKSAFPSIFRHVAFEFAVRRFPKLCRYFALLYGQAAKVTVTMGPEEIVSWQMERGAMQGDPLGGDFFVCAKAEFAKALNETFPDVWFSWIIDDLTCSMKVDQVVRVDEFIKVMGAACGLTVNEGKRGITSLLPEFTVTPVLERSGIPYELRDGRLEGVDIGTATLGGWNKLLGCPVGTAEFCRERAKIIVEKKFARLRDIRKFHHTQYEHVALSLCGGVADYLVRMLGPEVMGKALEDLDECKRAVFESTIQRELDDLRWQVAKAPSAGIGADIGDPAVVAIPQFLGALGATARTLSRLEDSHRAAGRLNQAASFEAVRMALSAKTEVGGLITQLQQVVQEVNIPNKILHVPTVAELQAMPSAAAMSEFFHERNKRMILRQDSWTRAQVVRLQSGGQSGAGLWLKVIPSLPCFRSPPDLFLVMLMSRLQLMWQAAECVRACRGHGRQGACGMRAGRGEAIDPNHYMFQCQYRNRFVGHDAVTRVIRAMYMQLGVPTEKEPLGLAQGSERPADILIIPAVVCRGAAVPVALDVGVTDPGKDGAVHRGSWKVPDGALKAAENYTREKRDKFNALKERDPTVGIEYRPLVFEATSARGPEAEKWWQEITGLAKDKESGFGLGYGALMEYNGLAYAWSGQTYARHWGMRLSLALMQSTHRYGLGKISEYTLLGGRRRVVRGERDGR